MNEHTPSADRPTPVPAPPEMVSVNARGGRANNTMLRIALASLAFAVLVSAALWGFKQYRTWKKARDDEAQLASKAQNKAALIGRRRTFSSDPEPAAPTVPKVVAATPPPPAEPIPLASTKPTVPAIKPPSRYGGELMVPAKENAWSPAGSMSPSPLRTAAGSPTVDANAQFARFLQQRAHVTDASPGSVERMTVGHFATPAPSAGPIRLAQSNIDDEGQRNTAASSVAPGQGAGRGSPTPAAPGGQASQGAVGALLTPSRIPMVSASLLGDRNLILPRGRTIDCSLATRVVNEVSGLAECVLASDVYSDNGQVVLLERGSQASGEYVALMTQGQRRLFILWTRVKTPHGVVINLASPASDALGAAGIGGFVDHRWGERLGAAVLLSMVKDAIALATAQSVSSSGAGAGAGIYAFQTTSATGERMVNQVLNSTINIKPTLYANPGDRAAIYVARDLDFGTVYALRAR